ncbi:MAG: hypothetical protein ACPK85_04710 [Methanosarcina sp.]
MKGNPPIRVLYSGIRDRHYLKIEEIPKKGFRESGESINLNWLLI